jgi:cell division protein ZapA
MQDYIAMVLIWFATEQSATASQQLEKDNIAIQLETIENLLENQLKAQH